MYIGIVILLIIISLLISVSVLAIPYFKPKKFEQKPIIFLEKNVTPVINTPNVGIPADPVLIYDHNKIYDPLSPPTRRVPRYQMPRIIDIPTRGYPDNYTQIGVLVSKCKSGCDDKILRLFGRQEYPRSNKYEYYTMMPSGADQIKIPIKTRKNELFDDDIIFIKELGKKYKVQLHDYDSPRYYPDV